MTIYKFHGGDTKLYVNVPTNIPLEKATQFHEKLFKIITERFWGEILQDIWTAWRCHCKYTDNEEAEKEITSLAEGPKSNIATLWEFGYHTDVYDDERDPIIFFYIYKECKCCIHYNLVKNSVDM